MSGWARRLAMAALCSVALVAVGCGGDDSGVSAPPSSVATSAVSPTSTSTTPSTAAGGGASTSTTGSFGPAPLVPGSGQTWADLYPSGQPPVFPLPNSSRAFPAPEAAALGFAREFLGLAAPTVTVAQRSDSAAELVVGSDGTDSTSRLTMRRDPLGWVVVSSTADGIATGLPPAPAQEPIGVSHTIALPAGDGATMVDVVDLADGRVVARQSTAAGTLQLSEPAPQLAALVVYVPQTDGSGADSTAADPSTPRRAQAASVDAVRILPS